MIEFTPYQSNIITDNQISILIQPIVKQSNTFLRARVINECHCILKINFEPKSGLAKYIIVPFTFEEGATEARILLTNVKNFTFTDTAIAISAEIINDEFNSYAEYFSPTQINMNQTLYRIPVALSNNIIALEENNTYPNDCALPLPFATNDNVIPVSQNTIYTIQTTGEQYIYTGEAWEKYSSSTNTITSEETEELLSYLFPAEEPIVI